MRISIVTISFNQIEYLKECIESIISQKVDDLEYIVIDPGSTDGSRDLIASYGNKIKAVFEPDAGPADGLAKGLCMATGDIIGFINSDDYLLEGCLENVEATFAKDLSLDVVMGAGFFVDKSGNKMGRIIPTKFTVDSYLYGAVSFIQQSVFFKKGIYHQAGGINRDNKTCWDGELFLCMANAGANMKIVHENWSVFRLHDGGITGSGRLTDEYLLESKSIFSKVKGREWRYSDYFISKCYKFFRILKNPVLIWNKVKR